MGKVTILVGSFGDGIRDLLGGALPRQDGQDEPGSWLR